MDQLLCTVSPNQNLKTNKSTMPPPRRSKSASSALRVPKLGPKLESLTFDNTARHDYLTGFHKRKLARIKQAQEAAVKREKEELAVTRKQIRDQRKAEMEERKEAAQIASRRASRISAGLPVAESSSEDEDEEEATEDTLGAKYGSDMEETKETETKKAANFEEMYVDEDALTSVVVEEMDLEAILSDEEPVTKKVQVGEGEGDAKKKVTRKKKEKKKKFRYLSKEERKTERVKIAKRKEKVRKKFGKEKEEKKGRSRK